MTRCTSTRGDRSIIETVFCVAGRAIGHERDQEGKYPLEGGSERVGEGHGVEPKGGIMDSDQQQQFCLKWNSFGNNLATSFSNLFKSESLTDVTLFCEGKLQKYNVCTNDDERSHLYLQLARRRKHDISCGSRFSNRMQKETRSVSRLISLARMCFGERNQKLNKIYRT